jgi:hypothetical protein
MKKIFLLLLFLPFLAPAQSEQEITDVLQEIVEDGGVYYVVTTTKFAAGPPQVIPQKIGGRQEMLTYAQTAAVNRQQAIAAARRVVVEDAPIAFRQFLGLDTLIREITGGDTTIYDLNAGTYFEQFQGRYRVRSGSGVTDYTAKIIRLANGQLRLERESDGVRYALLILSPKSFRLVNIPIGSVPAAVYDMSEISPMPDGKPRYRDENRIFTIVKLE